ncbi:MAG TPA: hypothetical protein VK439_13060 [Rubrivivax sp.]|nr:hypothetical protein [Rubrivivax sp.]
MNLLSSTKTLQSRPTGAALHALFVAAGSAAFEVPPRPGAPER